MESNLRAFIRYTAAGKVIPGSLILRKQFPKGGGRWVEIPPDLCCQTTTTTSTSTTSTTTSTTTVPSDLRLKDNVQLTGMVVGGLKEYSWDWNQKAKDLNLDNYPNTGVIAQEAVYMYPQYVMFDKNIGYFRVDIEGIRNN